MDPDFWHERWKHNQIGFHQGAVNDYLQQFWPRLGLQAGELVFVPLCGKSLDMCWLAGQGHQVLGIEVNAGAVQAFFSDQGWLAIPASYQGINSLKYDKYQILISDFFELTLNNLTAVAATYDRAALIALPPSMRAAYAEHLFSVLPSASPILLITLEYPQVEMNGPPFSVEAAEVQQLFAHRYAVTELARESLLEAEPHFRDKGLSCLDQVAWLLVPRAVG